MGNLFSGLGAAFGPLFAPIHTLFQYVFYEPVYNLLMYAYYLLHFVNPALAYGLAIIILTLVIRSALIPLTVKQLKSSRAMQVLAPQLSALKSQYKDDPQGMMAAQRALYKEHGVSPASGCLPLLIQMPILYGLFFSFYTTLRLQTPHESYAHHLMRINADIYPFLPHLHAIPATFFLWTNLANPDPTHILPILAGALTFFQLRMAMPIKKKVVGQNPDATAQATQSTMYIMPLITIFFGWQYASGLALYWTVGTLFSAVQQYFLTGWGSLATLPGFNRILPAPVEADMPGSNTLPRAIATSPEPVLATEVIEEGEAGIIGLFRRLLSPRTQPAASAITDKPVARTGQTRRASAANLSENLALADGTNGSSRSAEIYKQRERRVRPDAPKLVKQPTSAPGEAPSANGNGSAVYPKEIIIDPSVPQASPAANDTGTNTAASGGSNGSIGSNGTPRAASGGTRTPPRNTTNGKSPSSRSRTNRTKGGR